MIYHLCTHAYNVWNTNADAIKNITNIEKDFEALIIIIIGFARLSTLDSYYIPRDGNLDSYQDYIQILPNIDHPEVFGQHTNADIVTQITENAAMFKTMSSIQKQTTSTSETSAEDRVRKFNHLWNI